MRVPWTCNDKSSHCSRNVIAVQRECGNLLTKKKKPNKTTFPLHGGCKIGPANKICETCCLPQLSMSTWAGPGWIQHCHACRGAAKGNLELQLNADYLALSEKLWRSHPGSPHFEWFTLYMSTCRYFHFLTGLLSLQRRLPSVTTPLLGDPFICVQTLQTL